MPDRRYSGLLLVLLLAAPASATMLPPLADWQSRPFLSARDFWVATASPAGQLVLGHRLALFRPESGHVQATYFPVETGFRGAAYGNGMFVGVGYYGSVWSSPDGVSWTQRSIGGTNNLFAVTYGFDEFMAVGGYRALFYSTDGITWLPTLSLGISTLFDIVKGPQHVVTVGKQGQIISSHDGRGWSYHVTEEDGTFHNIAWGNGSYLALTREGVGRISTNAQHWERITVPSGLLTLAGNAEGFFATDESGAAYYSSDGRNWFTYSTGFTNLVNRLSWTGREFLAACNEGVLLSSPSGFHWRVLDTQLPAWTAWAATAEHQLALGAPGLLAHSTDGGETWWPQQSHPGRFNALTARGNVFWAAGPNGGVWSSQDAATWVAHSTGLTNELWDIAFAGLTGIAVGSGGAIVRSTGSAGWKPVPTTTTATLRAVAGDGSRYVAVGDGVGCASATGLDWDCRPLPGPLEMRDLATTRGIWIAAGRDGALIRSLDGLQWEVLAAGDAHYFTQVVTGNGRFLVAGDDGIVLDTEDGLAWRSRRLPEGATGGAWHYDRRRFRALGDRNLRWQSGDLRTPELQLPAAPGDTGLRVRLAGEMGQTYRLQRAPDPEGPWTDWQSHTLTAPSWEVVETPPLEPAGFFRGVTP